MLITTRNDFNLLLSTVSHVTMIIFQNHLGFNYANLHIKWNKCEILKIQIYQY